MIFLNDNPEFILIKNTDYEFYYTGIFDQTVQSIIDTLVNGKFPFNLKGNFAFFYKDKQRVVFAVDHLPTINLFYTNEEVSHIFYNLKKSSFTPNEEIVMQIRFFWGGSVGTETSINEIQRLEAGTYFEKKLDSGEVKVDTYIDLFNHEIDTRLTHESISEIVEQVVEECTRDNFNLLWSSGTDSNCLLGFIRKLQRTDRCNLISLYSDRTLTDERPQIEYLAEQYKLTPYFHNLGNFSGRTTSSEIRFRDPKESIEYKTNFLRTWNGWWHESTIFQKFESVYDSGYIKNTSLTGELGDQLFGSRFGIVLLKHLAQNPNSTSRDIASVFVSADQFRFNNMFTKEFLQWKQSLESDPIRYQAWFSTINWVEETWNKINCDGDFINRIELLQYKYKGSHRCYNSTQFVNRCIINPFSDYRIFHAVFKTPGTWKINKGKTRRLSLNIIKDFVDPGPWNWKKSGIAIPTQQIIPKTQLERITK